MAIASLVLGLASVGLAFFAGGFSWLSILVGIAGIICAVKGKQNPEQKGLATAGLILSIIGLVFGTILFIACTLIVGLFIDTAKDVVDGAADAIRDNLHP